MPWLIDLAEFRFTVDRLRASKIVDIAASHYPPAGGWSNASQDSVFASLDKAAIDYFADMSDEEAEDLADQCFTLH